MTPNAPASLRKTALVTGATNGIGKVTALELARAGYRVLFTARDAAKGQRVIQEVRGTTGNGALELFVGDLSSMDDVRRIALEVRERHAKLDVLINNAGGLFRERRTTVDGFETTFALNHLSYFLLTNLLLGSLKAAENARVVSVSSTANYLGRMRWADLEYSEGYAPAPAYYQSKLMNVLFANALARRLKGTGVTSNSLHPGAVRSGFDYNPGGLVQIFFNLGKLMSVSPEKGAETSLYLATSSDVAGVTGGYFDRKRPRRANATAYNEAAQEQLWTLSEKLVSRWLDPVSEDQAVVRS